jgi:pseudaminic acid synthase
MADGSITIEGRRIGPDAPPYVVAELSANHNGDITRAFAVMDAAKRAGADAIKLQTYTADTLTIDHDGPGFLIESGPWAGQTLHELYSQASMPWDWHDALFAKGREIGITVFSSPFDDTAVDFLETFDVPAFKIASFEANDLPLVERVAATGKPLIISTGMSSRDEIAETVDAARGAGCEELLLLHCVSAYPATPEDYNLRSIADMVSLFDTAVGLSDHTLGAETAIAAVTLGATLVEKHLTLRRTDGGPDSGFSAEPEELATLCQSLRTVWSALGTVGQKPIAPDGGNTIFRRSIYAVADIAAGDMLTRENIRSIRPGFGLAPKTYPQLLGRKAGVAIARGTPLSWDLVAPD